MTKETFDVRKQRKIVTKYREGDDFLTFAIPMEYAGRLGYAPDMEVVHEYDYDKGQIIIHEDPKIPYRSPKMSEEE